MLPNIFLIFILVYFGYACNVDLLCLSQPLSANYNTALHTELISAAGNRDLMTLRQQEITACSK